MKYLAGLSVLLAATPLAADDLAITIYNGDRALIEDVRTISFAQGRSRVELPNVSSAIEAQTVSFAAAGVSIVEQNFDFDLLSPDKLMEKAVGQSVRIVRTNPGTGAETTERATVLSVNRGVVVQIGERIEVLRDDNLPTRVIFDRVPPNLRPRPTLSVLVDSAQGGAREAKLTYLSNGLQWRADYVALFDEKASALDLQGWATLTNSTDTTFANAKTLLVAGDAAGASFGSSGGVRGAGMEAGDVERIGDNYLYPLAGKTTVASNQTKQVAFVDADGVAAKKAYELLAYGYQSQSEPQNVDVRISFSNSRAKGLGVPLPGGVIRVYARDSTGRAQFIGEDNIGHTPGGSDISLKIGEAFDVSTQSAVHAQTVVSKSVTETTMEYVVRNAKAQPATVTIRQQTGGWRAETEILEENFKSREPVADTYVWDVPVPAEGETILRFKVREKRK
ncbi:MAG: DUF4139 domain-containing protein [Parvularculaceae bacterium]